MKKIHYAWLICLCSTLMMFLSYGILANVFAVYIPHIVSINNFTYAQGSMLNTIRSLTSIVAVLTVNYLCKKIGIRKLAVLSIVLILLSRIFFSIGGNYTFYILGSALAGFSYIYTGIVPTSIIIGNWFNDSRNLALGISSAGSGIANIVLSPLVTLSIMNLGLGKTFLIEGILVLSVGILIIILLQESPSDVGLYPYVKGSVTKDNNPAETNNESTNRASSIKWIFVLFACFLTASAANAAFVNLTSFFDEFGFSSSIIGWLISFFGLTMIVGKITYGRITDKIGGFRSNFLITVLSVTPMLLLALCMRRDNIIVPVIVLLMLGIGQVISTIAQPVWARDLREKDFNNAISQLSLVFMLGCFVHNFIYSSIVNITSSYTKAYFLSAILSLIAMSIIQIVYFLSNKQQKI